MRIQIVNCLRQQIPVRTMCQSTVPAASKPTEPVDKAANSVRMNLGANHRVNRLEKYMLVHTKRYPSVDAVPDYVTQDMMERTRNIIRIRINISAMVLCLAGCFFAMLSGKSAESKGINIYTMNEEFHKVHAEQKK